MDEQTETPLASFERHTRAMVEAGLGDISRKDRVEHLMAIQGLARQGLYAPIDEVLRDVRPADISDRSIQQMLRGTFLFRGRLPHWDAFRDEAGDVYAERDMPAVDLMYGLGWQDRRTRFGALTRALMAAGMGEVSSEDRIDHNIEMHRVADAGEFRTLDMMLFESRPETLSELTLLHLLRGTFEFRDSICTWPSFRNQVGDILEHRGRPAASLLAGLDWRPLGERDPEMYAAREASRRRRAAAASQGATP